MLSISLLDRFISSSSVVIPFFFRAFKARGDMFCWISGVALISAGERKISWEVLIHLMTLSNDIDSVMSSIEIDTVADFEVRL